MDDPSTRPPEPAARAPGTPQQDRPCAHGDEAALTLGLRNDSPGTGLASVPGTAAPWRMGNSYSPYRVLLGVKSAGTSPAARAVAAILPGVANDNVLLSNIIISYA